MYTCQLWLYLSCSQNDFSIFFYFFHDFRLVLLQIKKHYLENYYRKFSAKKLLYQTVVNCFLFSCLQNDSFRTCIQITIAAVRYVVFVILGNLTAAFYHRVFYKKIPYQMSIKQRLTTRNYKDNFLRTTFCASVCEIV